MDLFDIEPPLAPEPSKYRWRTPPEFLDAVRREFGEFELDACADATNALAPRWITREQNALVTEWTWEGQQPGALVWMNPPFGAPCPTFAGTGKFVERAAEQASKHRLRVLVLVEARTDTTWFHEFALRAFEVRLVKGRLHYREGDSGEKREPAKFGSAFCLFDGRRTVKNTQIIAWDWRTE